jgi:membrane-bound lytic murein transglycosylase B
LILLAVLAHVVSASVAAQEASSLSFADFIAGVREEAIHRGLRPEVVDQALATLDAPLPIVIERDRTQAETVLSLERYLSRRLTGRFISRAHEALETHRALADEVSAHYGVPPEVIIAIWGLESSFGRFSGTRPTLAALATLAWDPRRPALFRGELFSALEILERGDIEVSRMRGSWAGAMGQVQFMPSSYLKFAEDFDGDGKRDIWSSTPDVLASIANYLRAHGWSAGGTWGREVRVSPEVERSITRTVARRVATCRAAAEMTVALPPADWQALGVRLPGGGPLPPDRADVALVSGSSRHFLVTAAYDALLEYNCSHSYALSVGLLADRLARRPAHPRHVKSHA